MNKTTRSIIQAVTLSALILAAPAARARPGTYTFKATFASGAEATVQMRGTRGKGGKVRNAKPYRIYVKRADGGRVLHNLKTGKVLMKSAVGKARGKGKGKKARFRTRTVDAKNVMFLLRGCSGSGKSTLARKLAPGAPVYSTDDFFMKKGVYKFDVKKLGKAHGWNQKRADTAARKGKGPIIVDNTMTRAWEARAYVESALENGYKIKIREPNTPWKFNAKELARRNSHGVSEAIIAKQISHYEHGINVADILKANR